MNITIGTRQNRPTKSIALTVKRDDDNRCAYLCLTAFDAKDRRIPDACHTIVLRPADIDHLAGVLIAHSDALAHSGALSR